MTILIRIAIPTRVFIVLRMKLSDLPRKGFYKEIWSKPPKVISAEYGISVARIVRLCQVRLVPVPSTGHWKRIQSGNPVKLPRLAKEEVRFDNIVVLSRDRLADTGSDGKLRSAKWDIDGYCKHRGIAEVNLQRAKDFLGLFFQCARIRNAQFDWKYYKPSKVYIANQWIEFELTEEKGGNQLWVPLVFRILKPQPTTGHSEWIENRTEPIQHFLREILHSLLLASRHERIRENERRERERLAWEAGREEREKKEQIERERWDELERIKALQDAALKWKKTDIILEFISECERRFIAEGTIDNPDAIEWLTWARIQASKQNPLSELLFGPPSSDASHDLKTPKKSVWEGPFGLGVHLKNRRR